MDMSSELANQALAQQVEQAANINSSSLSNTVIDSTSLDRHINQDVDPSLDTEATLNNTTDLQSTYRRSTSNQPGGITYRSVLSNNEQLIILREAYARNPNPARRELEILAERTGRPWNKIREYYRQRRNKMRGLENLESMEEPGRASGW